VSADKPSSSSSEIKHSNVQVEHVEHKITQAGSHIKIMFDLIWTNSDNTDHSDNSFLAVLKPCCS
jgi:hypothetical protein